MFSVAAQREVNAPIGAAFDYLADLRNEMHWNPAAREIIKLGDDGVRAGSRFSANYQGAGRLDVEILECSRPTQLRYLSQSDRMSFTSTIRLQELPDTTRIDLAMEVEPRGLLRLVAPLMAILLRRQFAQNADRLKAALDRE